MHTPPVETQLLEKKKKEEDELRRVQAERKKEEDRLAKLKAQREQLETTPKQPAVERKPVRERKVAVGGTFQRTVGDIVKGAQEKQKLPAKPQVVAPANEKKKSKPPKVDKPQEAAGPVSFGVKSFDQIMKEKTVVPNEEDPPKATPAQQPASNIQPKDSGYLEELKKKNQQKFSASSQSQKTEQPTKVNPPQKKGVPAVSPKRQLAEEPKQEEQKRQKTEQSLSKSEEVSADVVEIELDEDTLALKELLG